MLTISKSRRRLRSGATTALIAAFAAVLGFAATATADTITFDLSSPTNLSTLTPGQTFTVNVSISGLTPTNYADLLGADVDYSNLLTSPTTPVAGPIVPDAANFIGSTIPAVNEASGSFFDLYGGLGDLPVTNNGILFSFDLTAGNATGPGVISFSGVFADNLDSNLTAVAGDSLEFNIQSGGGPAAVPLPSTVLGGTALMGLLGLVQLRRSQLAK